MCKRFSTDSKNDKKLAKKKNKQQQHNKVLGICLSMLHFSADCLNAGNAKNVCRCCWADMHRHKPGVPRRKVTLEQWVCFPQIQTWMAQSAASKVMLIKKKKPQHVSFQTLHLLSFLICSEWNKQQWSVNIKAANSKSTYPVPRNARKVTWVQIQVLCMNESQHIMYIGAGWRAKKKRNVCTHPNTRLNFTRWCSGDRFYV